jgi:putative nucleotidyltransferase with HDIG domain
VNEQIGKKTTIGVLCDWTVDAYQQKLLEAVLDFTSENGCDCVCFEGGALHSPNEYEAQRNTIYDLVDSGNVDGLVILSAAIAQIAGPDAFGAFCERFTGIPTVGIALDLPGFPTVLTDNQQGLREVIVHLIEVHRARRFAFIQGPSGNQDSAERYNTFVATLYENALTVDPRLVALGSFSFQSGAGATAHILDQGIADLDAIVAANDAMALGALEELSRRRPARPIAVVGFDDIEQAAYAHPALTTVRQPIREQGWTAARLCLDLIHGNKIPHATILPTVPVIRQSCGCLSDQQTGPVVTITTAPEKTNEVRDSGSAAKTLADRLQALSRDGLTERTEKTFIETCNELGRLPSDPRAAYALYQSLLSDCFLKGPAPDACRQAVIDLGRQAFERVLEGERAQNNSYLQERRALVAIRELIVSHDTAQQMGILDYRLPEVGIDNCYVALYQTDSREATSLLGHKEGKRIDAAFVDRGFQARALVPDDFLTGPGQRAIIVKALKDIGFILFELQPRRLLFYTFLCDIIAGALQAAMHFNELRIQKNGISRNLESLRQAMAGFIRTMSLTVETRDPYTAGHQHRVSDLARNIAQELKLPPVQIEGVRMAAIIHDLGKIYVPSEILNRSGKLDDIEFSMIKQHPQVAFDILRNVDFPWPIADIVYQHHERMNGSGYPRGLAGETISLEARIIGVADVTEAMSSHRPYREALGIEMALAEIVQNKDTLYDPDVVDACVHLFIDKGYTFKK